MTLCCSNCGAFYSENWHYCPDCEVTLVPAGECAECHGDTRPGEKLCDSCKERTVEEFSDWLSQLGPEQVGYLDDALDGRSLREYWRSE